MLTAKDILESEAFKAAVKRVRERVIEDFERTPPENIEALTSVAYRREALGNILGELQRELHAPSINLRGKGK